MALIYWGQVDAASDITMSTIVDTSGTRTRQSIIDLISPVAAGIIAGNPTIIAAAEEAARVAVAGALAAENVVRAYPETPVTYTSLSAVPMHWIYKQLSQPYPSTYPAVYPGSWVGSNRRGGDLPVLSASGKLAGSQIPDTYWTGEAVEQAISEAVASIPEPELPEPMELDLPVFRARLVQARLGNLPLAVGAAGSSTTANYGVTNEQGYVSQVVRGLQTLHPADGDESDVQVSSSADFTEVTTSGVHGYNAGQGSTTSEDFLTAAEIAKMAAVRPALLITTIGANDWARGRSPAQYGASLRAKLQAFDAVATAPCQHLLIQSYPRLDVSSQWDWREYADVQKQIAAERTDTAFLDTSPTFAANGVPGSDPLDLVITDNIHPSVLGYALLGDFIRSAILRVLHHA